MKGSIILKTKTHNLELITNKAENFDKIVLCFHGFNGDKWGDSFSKSKKMLNNTLVCSFDSAGHGTSEVLAHHITMDIVLDEIDTVITYLKQSFPTKPIYLLGVSYGGYRIVAYLIKYKPQIKKAVLINPALKMAEILEMIQGFNLKELKEDDYIVMNYEENKFLTKQFAQELKDCNLYNEKEINYNITIIKGTRDSLIPPIHITEFARKYNKRVVEVNDEHCLENPESWQTVFKQIDE